MDVRRRMLMKKTSYGDSGGGSTTSGSYTVNLNGQWEKTTAISNPDSTLYDGVYRSSSNYNVSSGVAIMYITIKDCSSFKMYIRSYAESNYDYVMVSQLDKTINGNTSYSDTTLIKAHTRDNQQSGTALSSYTLVGYTGITSGEHTITVVYRKDGGINNGDDRGYVLIPKNQGSSDSEGSGEVTPMDNYLTIVALEDGLSASLSTNACEYCINGDGDWKSLSAGTTTDAISKGQTLSFRGNLTPTLSDGIGTFSISKKCNLKGNIMSMVFGDKAVTSTSLGSKNYTFYKLFYNCTNIVDASDLLLPATTLTSNCYNSMFSNCTSLTAAPKLPATTLATYCYTRMFYGCKALTTAPELPATKLSNNCYQYMLWRCTSLTASPELPATTLAEYCYYGMFIECSLTTAPDLPATTLTSNCYHSMFEGCNTLTTAPELPATTLAEDCYHSMFEGCTSLTTAPELPATTLATNCYYYMFYRCKALTAAPELPATTLAEYCYYGIFSNCTSLTAAPKLPATTLVDGCYCLMFSSCTSLTTAPKLPATTLAYTCYSLMFNDCTSLTAAPELPATTLASYCYGRMFNNCNSLTAAPKLPVTTLYDGCYYRMFYGCTRLTTAPELPATTLADGCYREMFYGCIRLNYIKMLAIDISASKCLTEWVYSVYSTGVFVKNPSATWDVRGTSGIPEGWTVQTA